MGKQFEEVNPIQGGPELTIQGGAKTPALHILAIFQSFQVRLEWNEKQM